MCRPADTWLCLMLEDRTGRVSCLLSQLLAHSAVWCHTQFDYVGCIGIRNSDDDVIVKCFRIRMREIHPAEDAPEKEIFRNERLELLFSEVMGKDRSTVIEQSQGGDVVEIHIVHFDPVVVIGGFDYFVGGCFYMNLAFEIA